MRESIQSLISSQQPVLAEGAVIERIRREGVLQLDANIEVAGLIYTDEGRETLTRIYRQYCDSGQSTDLPFLLLSPTWRASPDRLRQAGVASSRDINGDGVRFVSGIRATYGSYQDKIYVGGLLGCRGDAYRPAEALSLEQAAQYHRIQVSQLSGAKPDFLLASTLPAFSEAEGIARVMSDFALPYIISFVIRPSGRLLDQTPLIEAIEMIDATCSPPPLGYMANCVHASNFYRALEAIAVDSPSSLQRIIGIQANTAVESPEELDGSKDIISEDPSTFAEGLIRLSDRFGISILGGCCGSSTEHIRRVAISMLTSPTCGNGETTV